MSQHGVAKASHVEKRLQRGKLFEKLENQTSFLGKFVQMRVQARPAGQEGQGNLSNAISSKVRDASVSTRIHQKSKFALVVLLMLTVRRLVQWVRVKWFHILARQHLLTLL